MTNQADEELGVEEAPEVVEETSEDVESPTDETSSDAEPSVEDSEAETAADQDDVDSTADVDDSQASEDTEDAEGSDAGSGDAEEVDGEEGPDAEGSDAEGSDAGSGDGEEAGEAEEAPAPVKRDSPYDRPGRWYVLHTQSGYENKVKTNLQARTQSMNMEERIFEVVIPLEDVVEFKNGKKVVVQKKVFPGYLLCRLHLDDDSWFVVRNTPGVTGFAGTGNTPVPMRRSEVERHLTVKDESEDTSRKGRPRLEYGMGETVRLKEGPFADFQGEIVEINEEQLKVKVLVNIFGRETPVELEFAQVGKV